VLKKNISDGVGRRNESIDTPLYPPLFWLDNIFKAEFRTMERSVDGMDEGTLITINVPLFKKLRDIIFFGGENHFMSHFEGHFEGAKTFLTP
jgi:hypothetical protein